jgi:hypothetical protein
LSDSNLDCQHPLNSRLCGLCGLCGLCIVLVCLVQEKNTMHPVGVKPMSVSITTCSHVTIHIVLCRFPLLGLSWFIVKEVLHRTACSSILYCALGFKTVLEAGSTAVTELSFPAVFTVKHLVYITNAVGSYFLSSTSKHHSVIPICLPVHSILRL